MNGRRYVLNATYAGVTVSVDCDELPGAFGSEMTLPDALRDYADMLDGRVKSLSPWKAEDRREYRRFCDLGVIGLYERRGFWRRWVLRRLGIGKREK